jgi:hypothetical protein
MTKISIFKPNGESQRFIKDVSAYSFVNGLLTVNYTKSTGVAVEIRTTLPFFLEQAEADEPES